MRACLQCGQRTDAAFCAQDGTATVLHGRRPVVQGLVPGTLFASRYRIVGQLGRGGMGAVYDALHTGTGQPVAIKTLLLDVETDEAAVRRFFLEARICAGLQHPSTIRVFDFGQTEDGTFYLAMERLHGQTLGDKLRKLSRKGQVLGEVEATRIGCAVLRALTEAHAHQLVHRDLKPTNIFLHQIGREIIVKILDFGIARGADAGLTRTGTTVGTPSYMSPEQVLDRSVDGRADLYALGVVLFGCVAGQLPYSSDSSYALMMKHVDDPVPDLRQLVRQATSEDFIAVVEKALGKQPNERFEDAEAMRVALEAAAERRSGGLARMHAPVRRSQPAPSVEPMLASATWVAPARMLRNRRLWVGVGSLLVAAAALAVTLRGARGSAVETEATSPPVVAAPLLLPLSEMVVHPPAGPAPLPPLPQPAIDWTPVGPPVPELAKPADAPPQPKSKRRVTPQAHQGRTGSHAPSPFD